MLKYGKRKGGFMKYLNKILFGFLLVITINMLYVGVAHAADAYIVYDDPNGFPSQARYLSSTYSPGAKIHYVRSSTDFVSAWNRIAAGPKIDNLFLLLHGGTGVLYFYNESGWSDFNQLNYLGSVLNGNTMLLSCYGGDGRSSSVAYQLSKRTGSAVISALNSAVNYNWLLNKKPDLDDKKNGTWARISAIKGRTYKCVELGTSWKYSYLN